MRTRSLVFAAAALLAATGAFADEITDTVDEALKQYKAGQHSEAASSLEYAAQLVRQKKGEAMVKLLPQPRAGWKADQDDTGSTEAAAGMFGGGVTAKRGFWTEDADGNRTSNVDISIVGDSPMLQGMMMMFSNPMLMRSDGGKLERINGEKAIVKYDADNKYGQINLVVNSRYLVTIEGSDVSLEDLKAYAAAVDYKKLAALP